MSGTDTAAPLSEPTYEWLSDVGVLERLKSGDAVAKDAAERLFLRNMPRAVYRAQLLAEGEEDHEQYTARQNDLQHKGLFLPKTRREVEIQLSRDAKLDATQVFVYCPPKAPGYQRVQHWISAEPGTSRAVDALTKPYMYLRRKHLGLWEMWVFSSGDRNRDTVLGEVAAERLGFENKINLDRRVGRNT